MKVQYLGTGAAEGVPAVFCNCEYCRGLRARMAAGRAGREVRSRSQVILDGELSVDFPPDAYSHSLAHGVDLSAIKYLLVTHSHMDHFYAHDFILRGYKYAHEMTEPQLTIFGNAEVCSVFREDTRREMKDSVAPNIDLRTVGAYQELAFEDWRAYTFPAQHSSKEPLLYLIERGGKRVLHLTDTGKLPDESMDFLKGLKKRVDLVTFDSPFSGTRPSRVRGTWGWTRSATPSEGWSVRVSQTRAPKRSLRTSRTTVCRPRRRWRVRSVNLVLSRRMTA